MTALEEQLVDLDQQHQAALEVAVSNRDQLKEDNRQLQLQLLQLVNDRQQEQQVTRFGPPPFGMKENNFLHFNYRQKADHFFRLTKNRKMLNVWNMSNNRRGP